MADSGKTRAAAPADTFEDPEPAPAAISPAPARTDSGRDAAIVAARDAELARQSAVVDAVAEAGASELPLLGGPMAEPGLGR